MKGLLIKDLKIVAKQKKFLMVVLFATIFLALNAEEPGFSGMYVMLILSTLTLTTLSYDEMNGGMLFLLSLPASRKTYVREKYAFAVLNLVLAVAVALVCGYTEVLVRQGESHFGDIVVGVLGMVLVMGVMLSVAIPLDFKFGAEKGRMIVTAAMVGVALVGIGGFKVLKEVFHIDLIGCLTKVLGGIESEALAIGILVGGLLTALFLVLYCSYLIANRIMRKKEF